MLKFLWPLSLMVPLTACSLFQPRINVPKPDQVNSAVYDFGMPGGAGDPPRLNMNNARDKAVIVKVLNWISQSKYVSDDTSDFVPTIGPAHFTITLGDGSWIRIAPVLQGAVVKSTSNSTTVQGSAVPDEVQFSTANTQPVDLRSKPLYQWVVKGGWKPDLQSKTAQVPIVINNGPTNQDEGQLSEMSMRLDIPTSKALISPISECHRGTL